MSILSKLLVFLFATAFSGLGYASEQNSITTTLPFLVKKKTAISVSPRATLDLNADPGANPASTAGQVDAEEKVDIAVGKILSTIKTVKKSICENLKKGSVKFG